MGVEDDPAPVRGPLHPLVLGVRLPHDAPGFAMRRLNAHWNRAEMLGDVRIVDVVRDVPPAPESERDFAAVGTPGRRLRLERGQRLGWAAFRRGGGEEDPVVLALEDQLSARPHRGCVRIPGETGEPGTPPAADPAHPEVQKAPFAGDSVDHPLPVRRKRDPSVGFLIVEQRLGGRTRQVQALPVPVTDQAGDSSVWGPGREGEAFPTGLGRGVSASRVERPDGRDIARPRHAGDRGAVRGPAQLRERSGCRFGVHRTVRPQWISAAVGTVVDPPFLAAAVEYVLVNQQPAAVRKPREIANGRRSRTDPLGRAASGRGKADLAALEGGEPVPVRRDRSHRDPGRRRGRPGQRSPGSGAAWQRAALGAVGSAGGEQKDGAAEARDPTHGGILWGRGMGGLLVARFTRVGRTQFRGPVGPLCRPEVGVPLPASREGVQPCAVSPRCAGRDAGRRPAQFSRWGFRCRAP